MAGTLEGRHAFVTGAGRGIGAAIARALAADGAALTLAGRNVDALAALARELRERDRSARVETVALDVTSAESVERAFAQARTRLGDPAVLVNNAGQAASAPFLKTDAALWQRMLQVNLTGAMLCAQAALPGMLEAGWGRIVNVASTAGLVGYAYVAAYCAAKHGLVGLTRALALELATRGVTVNAVCPGYTDTDIVREGIERVVAATGRSADEARAGFVRSNPQGRLVRPVEVADAVAWLCGEGAGAVTGQAVSVSGGEVMSG